MNYIQISTQGDFLKSKMQMVCEDRNMPATQQLLEAWKREGGIVFKISKEKPADWDNVVSDDEETESDDAEELEECEACKGKCREDEMSSEGLMCYTCWYKTEAPSTD